MFEDSIYKKECDIHEVIVLENHPSQAKHYVQIKCEGSDLDGRPETRYFKYSDKWKKLNLKVGDKVKFRATIKTTEVVVHKTGRWYDPWDRIPFEDRDIEIPRDIQYLKQIQKI